MAVAVAPCPALEDPAAVRELAEGIRAEMMVAMLEALQGTAAACAEICLRRLQAMHRDLQLAGGEASNAASGADGGISYFLMSKDDHEAAEACCVQARVEAGADVDEWYAEEASTVPTAEQQLRLAPHALGETLDVGIRAGEVHLASDPLTALQAGDAGIEAEQVNVSSDSLNMPEPRDASVEAIEVPVASDPETAPEAQDAGVDAREVHVASDQETAPEAQDAGIEAGEMRDAIPPIAPKAAGDEAGEVHVASDPDTAPQARDAGFEAGDVHVTSPLTAPKAQDAGDEAGAVNVANGLETVPVAQDGGVEANGVHVASDLPVRPEAADTSIETGEEHVGTVPEAQESGADTNEVHVASDLPLAPETADTCVETGEEEDDDDLAAELAACWGIREMPEPRGELPPQPASTPEAGGAGAPALSGEVWRCCEAPHCGAGAAQQLLPHGAVMQCPASAGDPSARPAPGTQGGAEARNEEPSDSAEPPPGGSGGGREGTGGAEAPAEASGSLPESHEPVMDIMVPDGCTYQGEKIPEGCTVAQWKSLLEAGIDGSKVLYARKLICHTGKDKRKLLDNDAALPLRPEVVAVSGPGAVMQMLELALRKRLGTPLPPPIVAAEGRAFACASGSCRFMVHSDPACGNYCCNLCLESDGRGHGEDCEQRQAPRHAPKGKPQSKYRAMSLTTDDLVKKEATFQPLTGEAKKKAYEQVKAPTDEVARGNFIGPYCDGEVMSALDCKKRLTMHNTENAWTLDYKLNFYCELLYEGIFPMGYEIPCFDQGPIQTLLFCYDRKVSVWDFHETHVSRRVRKHAKLYSMTIDTAFDDVILGCVRQHGEAWLYRGYRWMLRKLFKEGYKGTKHMRFGIHTFELWDDEGQLVAGDLGCTIGGVYMSFSGFRMKDTKSCGEVQMVLTAGLLSKMGFDWMDLGQVLKYKERMGAKVITRKEYFARLSRDRDKTTTFLHDRVSGQELLAQVLQAIADGPKPMPTGDHDQYTVVYNKVAMREKPSLEARMLAVLHRDAELEGTPHDVGGVPWLQLASGWVLMDGKTLGLGTLVAPKHGQVDYDKGASEVVGEVEQQKEAEQPPEPEEAKAPAEVEQEPESAAPDGAGEVQEKDAKGKAEGKKAPEPKKSSLGEEEKRKKKAEKEVAARKKAAERVERLRKKQEEAARYKQAAEAAEQRALDRRENPEAFRPASLKEKKKWKREEEALRKKEEAELAKQKAAEEEAARLQAIEEMKLKRVEEVEVARKKAEEQAALKKVADQEAAKKRAEDEAIVRAMVLAVTEGAAPGPNAPKTLPREKVKAIAAKCKPTMEDQPPEDDGRMWIVTGGEGKGGILVRAAEGVNSRQLPTRLSTGTMVEELEIAGNRLHYKRIRGDGPDWGWVSIMLSGKLLVEPFPT